MGVCEEAGCGKVGVSGCVWLGGWVAGWVWQSMCGCGKPVTVAKSVLVWQAGVCGKPVGVGVAK